MKNWALVVFIKLRKSRVDGGKTESHIVFSDGKNPDFGFENIELVFFQKLFIVNTK
jgi:hypothetical protein